MSCSLQDKRLSSSSLLPAACFPHVWGSSVACRHLRRWALVAVPQSAAWICHGCCCTCTAFLPQVALWIGGACIGQQGGLPGGRGSRAVGKPVRGLLGDPLDASTHTGSLLSKQVCLCRERPLVLLTESFVLLCMWVRPRFIFSVLLAIPAGRRAQSSTAGSHLQAVPLCTYPEPSLFSASQQAPALCVLKLPLTVGSCSLFQSAEKGRSTHILGSRLP